MGAGFVARKTFNIEHDEYIAKYKHRCREEFTASQLHANSTVKSGSKITSTRSALSYINRTVKGGIMMNG